MTINDLAVRLYEVYSDTEDLSNIQSIWISEISNFQQNNGNIKDFITTNQNGWQLIHFAAANGLIDVVEWLVKQGVNIDEPDKYGLTPLMHVFDFDIDGAIQSMEKITFQHSISLISLGADKNICSNDDLTIDLIAKEYGGKVYAIYKDKILNMD